MTTPYQEGYAAGHAGKPRSNPYLKGWARQSEVAGWLRLGLRAEDFIAPEQWEQGYRAGITAHAAGIAVVR
jgi:ribosome modulation factor